MNRWVKKYVFFKHLISIFAQEQVIEIIKLQNFTYQIL